jgi:hypothetical protein
MTASSAAEATHHTRAARILRAAASPTLSSLTIVLINMSGRSGDIMLHEPTQVNEMPLQTLARDAMATLPVVYEGDEIVLRDRGSGDAIGSFVPSGTPYHQTWVVTGTQQQQWHCAQADGTLQPCSLEVARAIKAAARDGRTWVGCLQGGAGVVVISIDLEARTQCEAVMPHGSVQRRLHPSPQPLDGSLEVSPLGAERVPHGWRPPPGSEGGAFLGAPAPLAFPCLARLLLPQPGSPIPASSLTQLRRFTGGFGQPPEHWGRAAGSVVALELRELCSANLLLQEVLTMIDEKQGDSFILDQYNVVSAQLVIHPRFDQYAAAKAAYRTYSNERWLWHGTSHATLKSIIANGFLRDYNRAGAYGKGTYFAAQAKYSLNPTYAQPNARGTQLLLLSRVLVGETCVGCSGMQRPDTKPGGLELYDSMVNNERNPTIFVLSAGSDHRAYPEIVLQLRKKS